MITWPSAIKSMVINLLVLFILEHLALHLLALLLHNLLPPPHIPLAIPLNSHRLKRESCYLCNHTGYNHFAKH